MSYHKPYPWKQMPFVRIIIPFVLGIVAQWYARPPVSIAIILFVLSALLIVFISLLPVRWMFRMRSWQGLLLHIAMAALGALAVYKQDARNNKDWIGHFYNDTSAVIVTLQEPLQEKPKSYKAEAAISYQKTSNGWQPVTGKIILYFEKSDTAPAVAYGSTLIIKKPLQPIKNSGNPGAFDYERYNCFRGIHYQLFLKSDEYAVLRMQGGNALDRLLFGIQEWVVHLLKKRIPGKEESGVAEALLIGYRNDLDKDLVQAYSNTGVVHIIAISGLHLGMIYGIFVWLFARMKSKTVHRVVKPVVILTVLWLFSLVAGAAPSIVRSAVMFSLIVLGEVLDRKSSIYNTLAGAAFIMLLYDPFYLWDVGFQLSFAAVVSIVAFMKPIYNWFYFRNRIIDGAWTLSSVTLAAQVLTAPFIFYYFHQFPLLFMVTNFVAVPLSSLILYGELLLIAVAPFETIATFVGKMTGKGIYCMNAFIRHIDQLPNGVYTDIHTSLLQSFVLMSAIIA